MREIIFRGKRTDNGEWVYGNLFIPDKKDTSTQICIGTNVIRITYDIDLSTIGQYTGLIDKNGTKIFEEDIVHFDYMGVNKGVNGTATVIFQNGQFGVLWGWHKDFVPLIGFCNTTIEVIGNMHDNPELLRSDTE